jgi:hypothetical protein
MEALSAAPRIFLVRNFVSGGEAVALAQVATAERNPYRLATAVAEPGDAWRHKQRTRTSDVGWDMNSPVASQGC